MEITPQQLRDLDIPESFRGYNRDEVNDLLERAAETIDNQTRQIAILKDRVGSAVADVGRTRDNDDILQRTLIMAQRAADDAVAAATADAERIRSGAAAEAHAMLERSRSELQRLNDEERSRIQAEVLDLATRRDALLQDVAQLEAWDGEYRERLIRQIESDLNAARQRPVVQACHAPDLHAVRVDDLHSSQSTDADAQFQRRAATAVAAALAPTDTFGATAQLPAIDAGAHAGLPLVGSAKLGESAESIPPEPIEALLERPTPEPAPAVAPEPPAPAPTLDRGVPARSSYLDEVLAAPVPRAAPASPDIDLRSAEADRANLDDDAFFATLRDAVADDAPLGPSDHSNRSSDDDEAADAQDPSFREMFRRRR